MSKDFNAEEESVVLRMVQAVALPVLGNVCHVFMNGLNHVQVSEFAWHSIFVIPLYPVIQFFSWNVDACNFGFGLLCGVCRRFMVWKNCMMRCCIDPRTSLLFQYEQFN